MTKQKLINNINRELAKLIPILTEYELNEDYCEEYIALRLKISDLQEQAYLAELDADTEW